MYILFSRNDYISSRSSFTKTNLLFKDSDTDIQTGDTNCINAVKCSELQNEFYWKKYNGTLGIRRLDMLIEQRLVTAALLAVISNMW